MVTRVPAVADVLLWARESYARMSLEEAAKRLKVKPETLIRVERGDVSPSATMFRDMSTHYGLPEATLLRAQPPVALPLPKDFRSFEGAPPRLSFETVPINRVRRSLAGLVAVSEDTEYDVQPALPLYSLRDDPQSSGETERIRIGVPHDLQIALPTERAFLAWRVTIERLGISVFMGDFPINECRGVSLLDDARTPALIRTSDEKHYGARTFTLIHEYAHLLLRQAGISKHDNRSAIERYCNQFAAAFLLPSRLLDRVVGTHCISQSDWSLSYLDELARRLSVTISVLSLRLEDLDRAYNGFFADVTSQISAGRKTKAKPKAIPHQYIILNRFGHHYPRTVLNMVDSGTISSVEASRLLEASPGHFKAVRETLTKRSDLVLEDAG